MPVLPALTIKDYIIAGLAALLIVLATLSFGFSIFGIGIEGWKDKSERLQTAVNDFNKEQKKADELWRAYIADREKQSKLSAEKADLNAKEKIAEANDRVEQYIATHRVCGKDNRGSPLVNASRADRNISQGANGPSESAIVHEPNLIGVLDDDVRICTENTVRLQEAHNWALERIQNAPAR